MNEEEKENKSPNKTSTFNLIIGISTLLIAILGATFAYFSATASSAENDVTVQSAYVSISYDGGTEIKATNLIPATQTVALTKYQKTVDAYNEETDGDISENYDNYTSDVNRKCVDAEGREVCYVYQFSIESDGPENKQTDILASIKVNKNEFTNLSYILYEVEFEKDSQGEVITDKYGFGLVKNYTVVSEFTLQDQNSDNVDYTDVKFAKFEKPQDVFGDNEELIETKNPVACLFKYSDDASTKDIDDTSRCTTYSLTNKEKHTYQLVIWLEETGERQEEQGLSFEGTVTIEVTGDNTNEGYENGKITGKQ